VVVQRPLAESDDDKEVGMFVDMASFENQAIDSSLLVA
jgi:hypothetical protein